MMWHDLELLRLMILNQLWWGIGGVGRNVGGRRLDEGGREAVL